MKNRLVAGLLLLSTGFAAPVFASGYGPAPFYRPLDGAPASQRGQSAQTVAAQGNEANVQINEARGGVAAETTQSGSSLASQGQQLQKLYRGR